MKPVLQYSYDDLSTAHQLINTGDPTEAARVLQCIIYTMGDETPAEVYEQLGITRRLRADGGDGKGFYELAHEAFALAEKRATAIDDRLRLGQILRNRAMVSVSEGDLDMAEITLRRSLNSLRPTRKPRLSWLGRRVLTALSFIKMCKERLDEDDKARTEQDAVHLEYFVSQGFIARLHYQRGGLGNRRAARKLFRRTNRELYGNQPYELNNRVWHFKVEWWWYRLFWAGRTLRLARESGNRDRLFQVWVLIFCPYLAGPAQKIWKARKAR
jgi:hypothetical protein